MQVLGRPLVIGRGIHRIVTTLPNPSSLAWASQPGWLGVSRLGWTKALILTILGVWLFYVPCLHRLWSKTNPFYGDANWGHSVLIPIVGLYYLYLNRDELAKATVKPLLIGRYTRQQLAGAVATIAIGALIYFAAPHIPKVATEAGTIQSGAQGIMLLGALAAILDWGIGTLLFGLLVTAYGIYPGQNDWLKDFGMVITIFGVVLTLCGWEVMQTAAFPILFLICALPWPALVYSKVASPLQQLAANVATGTLDFCGINTTCSGTKIIISRSDGMTRTLNVAEACAGLRSLMTFISVGGAVAFLSQRPLWQKLTITFSAIPIAIFCNVMRVCGQGFLDTLVSTQLSESFAHQFVGLVMLVPAFFLILLVGWILDQIFVEEADEPATTPPPTKLAGGNA